MPLPRGKNREDCISKSYNEMIAHGHPKDQARAAALSHCNKIYGGIPKKKDLKKELEILKEEIEKELDAIRKIRNEFKKQK